MNEGESYGNQNSKVMPASMQGQVGLTQWLHHHLLSHCPHCLAAELSVPCILICSVCFIQLSSREDLPLHPELSTIMQFGTAELVTPVRTHSGTGGLIGSWPQQNTFNHEYRNKNTDMGNNMLQGTHFLSQSFKYHCSIQMLWQCNQIP